jgi:hypothetical protein
VRFGLLGLLIFEFGQQFLPQIDDLLVVFDIHGHQRLQDIAEIFRFFAGKLKKIGKKKNENENENENEITKIIIKNIEAIIPIKSSNFSFNRF